MTALLFMSGLVLLVAGGEVLVRGAARLAATTGIRPLVIGLTVVAFGTSSPELAVSVAAAMSGKVDIAVGNVVGSNIFNVLFILGVSAAIVPLAVSAQLVRIDVPIMIGVSELLLLLALDGHLGRWECILLAIGIVAYLIVQVVISRHAPAASLDEGPVETGSVPLNMLLIGAGLVMLVFGSRWLVQAAVDIAQLFGVTELVIGLTIVAAGTSMPEVATSVVAALRGQRDIAVGNIIGSNIFNILAVLGISGAIAPDGLLVSNAALTLDIPIMIAVALICFPIFFGRRAIPRWEGLLFVAYYALYMAYLVLDASNHEGLAEYRYIVLTVVLPLTLITLIVFNARGWIGRRRERNAPDP